MLRILLVMVVVLFGLVSCGEPAKATLSVIIVNQSTQGETITALRFPQSGVSIYQGWVAPAGGKRVDNGIAVPTPYNLLEVDMRSDANVVRTFRLDLTGHGQVNSIGRIEYRLEINATDMRVVPIVDWPKPSTGPALAPPRRTPSATAGVLRSNPSRSNPPVSRSDSTLNNPSDHQEATAKKPAPA